MSAELYDKLISAADADRLITAHDGDVALLYLFRLRTGCADPEAAAAALCRTRREIECAAEKLSRMGLGAAPAAAAARPSPLPDPVDEREAQGLMSQYKSEDIVRRSREDEVFRMILDEARRVMGRNLSSVDMKLLFGVYDYLGLPSDVMMLMINYCGRLFEEKYRGQRRPTAKFIQKEADLWARQEIMTMEQAEAYMSRRDERRSRISQVKELLGIRGRELSVTERGYIDSWLELGFEDESLAEAYDRTVTNTGALKWGYMNKILLSWHEKGLHRLADILEKEGRGRRSSTAGSSVSGVVDLRQLDDLIDKI